MVGTIRTVRYVSPDNVGVDILHYEVTPNGFVPFVILLDEQGNPLGTAANPLQTAGGAGGGGNVAKATAAAPSYAEGATVPLSVDLAGTLRSTAGAGGGSGGAVTVADGADVAQGTTTDVAWASGAGTVIGLLKAVIGAIKATLLADVTDRAARLLGHVTVDNASLPVTGTFWQATQPVSGTVTDNQGTPAAVANAWPVKNTDGTNTAAVKAASTAVAATDPALAVGLSPNSPLPAGTNALGTTLGPALTKGTQGATGYSVQDLKDAGRQQVSLNWEEMAGTSGAESALTSFTSGSRNAAALTAASSYTVTAGKTLRIQAINIYLKNTSTVALLARFRIRQAASGIANTSAIIWGAVLAQESPTWASGEGEANPYTIPDGLEVAGGQQITFTWLTNAATCTLGMSIIGYEY